MMAVRYFKRADATGPWSEITAGQYAKVVTARSVDGVHPLDGWQAAKLEQHVPPAPRRRRSRWRRPLCASDRAKLSRFIAWFKAVWPDYFGGVPYPADDNADVAGAMQFLSHRWISFCEQRAAAAARLFLEDVKDPVHFKTLWTLGLQAGWWSLQVDKLNPPPAEADNPNPAHAG